MKSETPKDGSDLLGARCAASTKSRPKTVRLRTPSPSLACKTRATRPKTFMGCGSLEQRRPHPTKSFGESYLRACDRRIGKFEGCRRVNPFLWFAGFIYPLTPVIAFTVSVSGCHIRAS